MTICDIRRSEPELIQHIEEMAAEVAVRHSLPVVALCSRRKARPIPAARQEYFRLLRARIQQCDRLRRYRGPTGKWVGERRSYYRITDAAGNVAYETPEAPAADQHGWRTLSSTRIAWLLGLDHSTVITSLARVVRDTRV